MHQGQFKNLGEVLNHYNEPTDAHVGHNELNTINLSKKELAQIEAFLHSLSSSRCSRYRVVEQSTLTVYGQ